MHLPSTLEGTPSNKSEVGVPQVHVLRITTTDDVLWDRLPKWSKIKPIKQANPRVHINWLPQSWDSTIVAATTAPN